MNSNIVSDVFKQFDYTLNEKEAINDSDLYNYIGISDRYKFSEHLMDIDTFNRFLSQLIKTKIENHSLETDNRQLNMMKMYSVLYLDVDYNLRDQDETMAHKINHEIYVHFITVLLKNCQTECKILPFEPVVCTEEDGECKCGFHIYLCYNKAMTRNERLNKCVLIQNMMSQDVDCNKWMQKYSTYVYEHNGNLITNVAGLIDVPALKREGPMMVPFCKKDKNSRNYKFKPVTKDFNYYSNLIHGLTPEELTEYNILMNYNHPSMNIDSDWAEQKKIPINERRKQFIESVHELLKTFPECEYLIDANVFIYDFMDACSYLCEEHPFLKLFAKGIHASTEVELDDLITYTPSKFIKLLIKFYYSLILLMCSVIPEKIDNYITDIITLILDPLYSIGGKTNRDDVKKQIHDVFTYLSPRDELLKLMTDEGHEKIVNFKYISKLDKKRLNQLRTSDDDSKRIEFENRYRDSVKVTSLIRSSVTDFANFVDKHILDKLTCEIEPFDNNHRKRDIDSLSYEQLRDFDHRYSLRDYNTILINLNKMFILSSVILYQMDSIQVIIEKIIKCYIRNYIYVSLDTTSIKQKDKIYIYNIKQTAELECLPYNQWIEDQSEQLKNWLSILYNKIFEPLYSAAEYDARGGINRLLHPLADIYHIIDKPTQNRDAIRSLHLPDNPAKYLDTSLKNVIGYYKSNKDLKPVVYLPNNKDTKYFGVRNGIIEYYQDPETGIWSVKLHKNNRDKILNAYTLAKFDPNYDFENSKYYAELNKIFSDIYPRKDEKDYILRILATTVCPYITKDQILFVYGTGADGKSTANRIIGAMLGNNGTGKRSYWENGERVELQNPSGYASTIKSNALTGYQRNSSNHDEGGCIKLENKTFCVAQEPPNDKLNSEVIKDWTSNGITNGRGLQQRSREFIVNTLICVETNLLPRYDIIDDAMHRRVIVFPHRAKFLTSGNEKRYKHHEFTTMADPSTINRLTTTVEYWQALLQMFVKLNISTLNGEAVDPERKKKHEVVATDILSNINSTQSIRDFTNTTFGKSSGLSSWLIQNIVEDIYKIENHESRRGCLNVRILADHIKRVNSKNIGEQLLEFTRGRESDDEITKTIQDTYGGELFIIKPELIFDNLELTRPTINQVKVSELINKLATVDVEQIVTEYTTGHSISALTESNDNKYRDVIILGYKLVTDEYDN